MPVKLGNTANGGGKYGKRYIPAGHCGAISGTGAI